MNDYGGLEIKSGRTKPLFMLGCAICLKNDSTVSGARIAVERKPERSHIFPESGFDQKTADGIIEFVMQQLRYGERKFQVETSSECASATGVTFGLSLLFDTGEHFECGPLGGMTYNYLRCAYDRWRGKAWRTQREARGPADPGIR